MTANTDLTGDKILAFVEACSAPFDAMPDDPEGFADVAHTLPHDQRLAAANRLRASATQLMGFAHLLHPDFGGLLGLMPGRELHSLLYSIDPTILSRDAVIVLGNDCSRLMDDFSALPGRLLDAMIRQGRDTDAFEAAEAKRKRRKRRS